MESAGGDLVEGKGIGMADYWIKLYLEITDDPKMATLPDRLWRRTIESFLLAGKIGKGGWLPETKQLAWLLRMDEKELELDLVQIERTGMLRRVDDGWFVVNFAERQSAVSPVERKRQQRQRDQKRDYYNETPVTNLSRSVTQINRTESDTESEFKEEESAPKSEKGGNLPAEFQSVLPEDRPFLINIITAFSERCQNKMQVETLIKLRGTYGEEKAWEALAWYAKKGISLGEAILRAEHALPTWGQMQKPPRSNGKSPPANGARKDDAEWQAFLADLRANAGQEAGQNGNPT